MDERGPLMLHGGKIPPWIKLLFTLYVVVFIPTHCYLYGPANLLWFCNLAVLLTFGALWLESGLLAGMAIMPIVYPHLIWQIDAVLRLAVDTPLVGAADYMFDPDLPVMFRLLSLNHVFLLYLLIWLIRRLGYDRRTFAAQSLFAAAVIAASYVFATDIHAPVGNINKIYGLSDIEPQTWMSPLLWLLVLAVFELLNNAVVHLVLSRLFTRRPAHNAPFDSVMENC